ncbi:uncharacterized protein TrAFT101_003207 [Trichoderma asperellum]|uniref:uncharacterized protein n=1 Tax=Trichoderma asperellum TaxID=101201 RepID=UPI00332D0E2E|nr:hypothetical protein TrAFT101_003207 [Trichoderma asperellum]
MDTSQQSSGAPTLSPEVIAFAGRMYDAARAGDVAVFQQALPAGLPPNTTNEKGDTLLMLAAYHGHADLVKLLIEHGADPNRVNDRGQSPLAGAVFKKEDAVIEERTGSGRRRRRPGLRKTNRHGVYRLVPAGGYMEGQV